MMVLCIPCSLLWLLISSSDTNVTNTGSHWELFSSSSSPTSTQNWGAKMVAFANNDTRNNRKLTRKLRSKRRVDLHGQSSPLSLSWYGNGGKNATLTPICHVGPELWFVKSISCPFPDSRGPEKVAIYFGIEWMHFAFLTREMLFCNSVLYSRQVLYITKRLFWQFVQNEKRDKKLLYSRMHKEEKPVRLHLHVCEPCESVRIL